MTITHHVGPALDVVRGLPDASIDLVATSPPFLALRNYNDVDGQWGSEPTPAAFLDNLLELATELRRVLAPHGSIAFELGDTYSGSGGAGGDYNAGGLRDGQAKFDGSGRRDREADTAAGILPSKSRPGPAQRDKIPGWPLAKSLTGVPTLFAWSLAYGRNLLNPDHTFDPWRIRNVIVWARNNPPVGALGDKYRPATSYITVATPSAKRWFDLDAVRTEAVTGDRVMRQTTPSFDPATKIANGDPTHGERMQANNPAGAPPLDHWTDEYDGDTTWLVNTQGTKLAHYACVDDQTQALTRRGWVSHHEIVDGDEIACYDPLNDLIEWRPATINRYHHDGEMVSIEKRETSQLLTKNHRVIYATRNRRYVATADELLPSHRLPVAAPFHDETGGKVGTSFAALLGWYITEGTERANTVDIYQSETVNPQHCATIRRLLHNVGADYTETSRQRTTLSAREGWTEIRWTVRGAVADQLRAWAPAKRLTPTVVFDWSHSELRALLDAIIDGDGHRRDGHGPVVVQQSTEFIDMLQALVCRLGMRSTIGPNTDALALNIGSRRWLSLRGANGAHEPIPRVHYTGTVWCPTTPTGFWLARRNGRPFITGNSWPATLAERLVLSMCPAEVCQECGEPRRRLTEKTRPIDPDDSQRAKHANGQRPAPGRQDRPPEIGWRIDTTTLGWSDCGHGNYRPGVVLDPFAGTGTTLAVADLHGRDAIGIDLDPANTELHRPRYDEVKKSLFGVAPPMPGQMELI